MRHVGLVALASVLCAGSLAAQDKGIEKGLFEIGGFARYNKFPSVYEVTPAKGDRWGVGGRLGYFLARNWAIELDGSWNPADLEPNQEGIPATFNSAKSRPLLYNPYHLQVVYNAPLSDHFLWMFGVGGDYTKLTKAIHENDIGFGGMTGLRWRALHNFSIRAEGTIDVLPKAFRDKTNTYIGAQIGASFLLGSKGCEHANDVIAISPPSATLTPGQTQTFTATSMYCGSADQVVYRLTGPGTLDSLSGLYTATTPGSAQITAYSRRGRMTSAAAVTITNPAPPPPPPAPAPPPPPMAPPPAPPAAPPAPPRYQFDLQMVHFRFDHADLTKGGQDSVAAIAETLKAHPEVNVDVIGHTDWIGTEAYNMKLSRARAETVRRLLVKDGVDNGRITVKWRGKDEPIADNKTSAGRAMNRRAEVKQNN